MNCEKRGISSNPLKWDLCFLDKWESLSLNDLLHHLIPDWFSTRLPVKGLMMQALTGKADWTVSTCIDFQQPPLLLLSLLLFTLRLLLCRPCSPLFLLWLPLLQVLLQCLLCGERKRESEKKTKRRRKPEGLLNGVNYSSAEPVKGRGSCQTPQTSLSGTIKVRWSQLLRCMVTLIMPHTNQLDNRNSDTRDPKEWWNNDLNRSC